MALTFSELKECFDQATKEHKNYVGFLVEMPGFEKPELITNIRENFEGKVEYIGRTYDENLVSKFNPEVKIVACAYGGTPNEIVIKLRY
ncbi:hypothetical protein CEW46_21455 [Bacillus cereus]|nr:hypothetical protein CEW46_21455 [Bacillus cereus]